jgi:protein-S-isoprenylcysteine O-methyltransferase Ste14
MPPTDRPSEPTGSRDFAERPSTIPWPPILLLGGIAGAIILGYAAPLPWPGLNDVPAHAIGLSLGAAGIGLLVYSIVTLRRHDTTFLPDKGATTLVTNGPYRRFRNPIYLADCLILLGIAEVTQNVWFVVVSFLFALAVTWLAILPEERHLERRFGDAYLAYKAKSRRWI